MSAHFQRPSAQGPTRTRTRTTVHADSVRAALMLRSVIDETRRLFHSLARTAEALHAEDDLTGGERAILLELAEDGPQTVPDMARARSVTRQHIQSVVNPLLESGLAELTDNPRHRRSKLVRLTGSGKDAVARIRRREGRVVAALVPELRAEELEVAARTLSHLADLFAEDLPQALGRKP